MSNRNEGYIEIKNGSIWKKVAEENWDENREKMLCQYLGFEEIDGKSIETTQLGSGQEIVTGDLICYNTQSNRTSCCVHLKPLTTNTSTAIPDVRCKYTPGADQDHIERISWYGQIFPKIVDKLVKCDLKHVGRERHEKEKPNR